MKIDIDAPVSSREEAQPMADAIFSAYHPTGYGTSLMLVEESGKLYVRGYRYDSCD